MIAPHDAYFWPNFAHYWLPTGAVVALIAMCGARPSVAYGVATALCAFMLLYFAWLWSFNALDAALRWVGYYFSTPAAVFGAFAAHIWVQPHSTTMAVEWVASFAWTFLGPALNLGALCLLIF